MKKQCLIAFSVIVVITIILFVVFNFGVYNKKYSNYVVKYSREYELESALVYAVIKTESNFDSNAVSKSGALGLMQIIPNTAKWIATELNETYDNENMFNADVNIKYGCYYLRYLFDKFKNTDVVICAYNAGETAVLKWLDSDGFLVRDKIDYAETRNYLSKVEGYYEVYKSSDISI